MFLDVLQHVFFCKSLVHHQIPGVYIFIFFEWAAWRPGRQKITWTRKNLTDSHMVKGDKFAERKFCCWNRPIFSGPTVDGRNPAPPGMYKTL